MYLEVSAHWPLLRNQLAHWGSWDPSQPVVKRILDNQPALEPPRRKKTPVKPTENIPTTSTDEEMIGAVESPDIVELSRDEQDAGMDVDAVMPQI